MGRDICPENALREVVEEEETPSVTIAKRWVTCPGSALNLLIEGVEEEEVVAGAVEVTEAGVVTEAGEEAEGVATSVAIIRGNNLTERISILLSGFIQFFFFPVE